MPKSSTAAVTAAARPAPSLGTYQVRPVSALKPYEKNARTHSAEQVEQLTRSIREFGFTNPLLVDEQDRIIAGHGRLQAALALGMSEVPVIILAGLTELARQYREKARQETK